MPTERDSLSLLVLGITMALLRVIERSWQWCRQHFLNDPSIADVTIQVETNDVSRCNYIPWERQSTQSKNDLRPPSPHIIENIHLLWSGQFYLCDELAQRMHTSWILMDQDPKIPLQSPRQGCLGNWPEEQMSAISC